MSRRRVVIRQETIHVRIEQQPPYKVVPCSQTFLRITNMQLKCTGVRVLSLKRGICIQARLNTLIPIDFSSLAYPDDELRYAGAKAYPVRGGFIIRHA